MHVRLGEVVRQRPHPQREGVPAPPDCAQRRDADLDHVTGLRAGHLHRAEHRVRAVRVPVPQRLPVGEAHPELGLVPPVRPGVGVTGRVARLDHRDRLGGGIEVSRTDRLRRGLDNVRAGHCSPSPSCSGEPLELVRLRRDARAGRSRRGFLRRSSSGRTRTAGCDARRTAIPGGWAAGAGRKPGRRSGHSGSMAVSVPARASSAFSPPGRRSWFLAQNLLPRTSRQIPRAGSDAGSVKSANLPAARARTAGTGCRR